MGLPSDIILDLQVFPTLGHAEVEKNIKSAVVNSECITTIKIKDT